MRSTLDWRLITPALVIITLGLTTLGSISLKLLTTQVLFLLIGLVLFVLVSQFPLKNHFYLIKTYFYGSIIFLILPLVFGAVSRGAIRWIQLGNLTVQPSELIKPFLIMVFAAFLTKPNKLKPIRQTFVYLLILLVPALLIFNQPDLGSTLVIIFIWLAILFTSNISLKLLGLTGTITALIGVDYV